MRFRVKILTRWILHLFFFLHLCAAAVNAASLTWTGLGADNLASNPANWTEDALPKYGDDVLFDATSGKDCTWDFDITLSSFRITPAYTGTVTNNVTLTVAVITTAAPTAATEPASNLNVPSVTLNATIHPQGLDTDVYFELGETTEYAYMTPVRTIPAGGAGVPFAESITGLSANTQYHYRVVATNAEGTTYGDDVSFILSPISITITSPLAGANIARPDVLVKGTIATTGAETGVTVNGRVAMTYGNKYAANHIPLTEGANTITVTATDTEGNTASASITVNAVTTGPYIRVIANPESGVSPLETTLKIDGTFVIDNSGMSVSGPGSVELLPGGNTIERTMRMTVPGIYTYTTSVTGPDSVVYQDTVAVTVLNLATLDALLRSIWTSMTNSLGIGNSAAALAHISVVTRSSYEVMFDELASQMPTILTTQRELNFLYTADRIAKYELVTEEMGQFHSYEVTFVKDEYGIWRILQY